MSKIDLDLDNDFGFSDITFISEADISKPGTEAERYKEQRDTLYKMIIPLVNNLLVDPEKEYIFFPNRKEKLEAFKLKLKQLTEN